MFIAAIPITVLLVLFLRSIRAEYQYYQGVKSLEPQLWSQLGSPRFLQVPLAFLSSSNKALLNSMSNPIVQKLAANHRRSGLQFLVCLATILLASTVYFKWFA